MSYLSTAWSQMGVDITSAYTLYDAAEDASENHMVICTVYSSGFHTDRSVHSITVYVGGYKVNAQASKRIKPAGETSVWYQLEPIFIPATMKLKITLHSDNANDSNINIYGTVFQTQQSDVCYWQGTAPAALTDTDKIQTSVQHIAASYDYTNTNVWHVSKSGNDGNGGHSWGAAKLTVAAAVAAASNGDTIIINPGEYNEEVNASTLSGITIKSAYGLGTHLTNASTPLKVGSYTTVDGLRLTNSTEVTAKVGLYTAFTTGCRVRNCHISGKYDGMAAGMSSDLFIENSYIHGTYDGINLTTAENWHILNSVIKTDCTYNSGGQNSRALFVSSGNGIAHNTAFIAERNDTTAHPTYGVYSEGAESHIVLDNCYIRASQANGGASGNVAGVYMDYSASSIHLNAGSIHTAKSGSGDEYSLQNVAGLLTVSPSVCYDDTKTNGTITRTGVADIVADTNELQTDWADGGRLDALLDLVKIKTDLITSANITVTSAVTSDSEIEIVQHDDYLDVNSRTLSWQNTSGDWFAGDLTDAAVALTLTEQDGTLVLTKAGSVVTPTGTQEVSVELTAASTALFTLPGKQYKYQLLLTKATYRETEVTGDVIVTLTNNEPS